MRAIAEWRVLAVFAGTPSDLLRGVDSEFLRAKFAAFVAAVAEGLLGRFATAAPPIVSCFQVHDDGLFAWDNGISHRSDGSLRPSARKGSPEVALQQGFHGLMRLTNVLLDREIS